MSLVGLARSTFHRDSRPATKTNSSARFSTRRLFSTPRSCVDALGCARLQNSNSRTDQPQQSLLGLRLHPLQRVVRLYQSHSPDLASLLLGTPAVRNVWPAQGRRWNIFAVVSFGSRHQCKDRSETKYGPEMAAKNCRRRWVRKINGRRNERPKFISLFSLQSARCLVLEEALKF